MRESSTYQFILDEGRTEEAQKIILRLGRLKFGSLDPANEEAVKAITDLERLERISVAILNVRSWKKLLETP